MVCTLCALFILWRRADSLRSIVSHQCVLFSSFPATCVFILVDEMDNFFRMKTFTRRGGNIRLSEDDGPPSRDFIEDLDTEDEDDDDVPLALRVERVDVVTQAATSTQPEHVVDLGPPNHR
jgi:hypothetical protein